MGTELTGDSKEFLEEISEIKDIAGRVALNSVFGERIIGQRIPSISAQFMYGVDTRTSNDLSANGGSISFTDSLLQINSGVNANGDGLIESKQALRYIPGHEAYCYFTTIFDTSKDDSRQEAGLFEENNGFWIGYQGKVFGLMRLRAGVEHWVLGDDFDVDIISGNNEYGLKVDPAKGNVWRISYGYLGFAIITLEVLMGTGEWIRVHTIKYPNSSTETHIANTYLPLRGRAINTGNTTNLTLSIGSVSAGIIDGGSGDETGRSFSASLPAKSTGTNTMVVLFKNKSTFNSIANRVESKLLRLSISSDGAQPVNLQILKNATITNSPTWSDVDADNSTHEYSLDATVTTASAYQTIAFELAKSENYVENVTDLNIQLYPGETALFLANGTNSVSISLNWIEKF